jgi:hypothetical protein
LIELPDVYSTGAIPTNDVNCLTPSNLDISPVSPNTVAVEYTSGSSINKRSRISKHGNARIRRCLYMATMIAVRVNPVLREFYKRLLERGKSKKVAIVASMRKLLHLIWGVLKNQRMFEPQYSS